MTTLIAWVSYSATGERPELARAISDSRITWGSHRRRWDAGRKVFTPSTEPHVFGFCGEVVFLSLIISQIVSAIDNNILFKAGASPDEKHELIFEMIKNSYQLGHNAPNEDFSIVHSFRQKSWPETEYSFWHIEYIAKKKSWRSDKLQIPNKTDVLIALGTGDKTANNHTKNWMSSDVGGTSRAIFSGFCDAINSGGDPCTGGPPQVCALYSAQSAKSIGVIKDNSYYLHGLPVPPGPMLTNLEWCNELFERINPKTNERAKGARRFTRPDTRKFQN